MLQRNEELRRIASVFVALGEVLALAASGEHPVPVVLERFDECASKCLREIEDAELRDPLETQISFLRRLIEVEATETLRLSARPLDLDEGR